MNIKHTITSALSTAAALVLASCGVQIQMESAVPAEINLGRGTMIACEPHGNNVSQKICYAVANRINQDGYYTVGSYNNGKPMAFLEVMNAQLKTTSGQNYSYTDLITTIRIADLNDHQLYRRSLKTDVDEDQYGNLYIDDACRTIARTVMLDLTPHAVTYKEKVSPNDENPAIEMGAKACASGNWELGRSYAQQAIAHNPNDPEAYYLLGLIERNALNYAQSTANFEKAYSIEQKGKYKSAILKNSTFATNEANVRQQLSN
ncbi:MAG: hypothetical protein IKV82_00235 [Akkermansia sp.]|nr:hypothetical protein [Akkermansia sp.]